MLVMATEISICSGSIGSDSGLRDHNRLTRSAVAPAAAAARGNPSAMIWFVVIPDLPRTSRYHEMYERLRSGANHGRSGNQSRPWPVAGRDGLNAMIRL